MLDIIEMTLLRLYKVQKVLRQILLKIVTLSSGAENVYIRVSDVSKS